MSPVICRPRQLQRLAAPFFLSTLGFLASPPARVRPRHCPLFLFNLAKCRNCLDILGLLKLRRVLLCCFYTALTWLFALWKAFNISFSVIGFQLIFLLLLANLYCKLGGCHLSKLSITQLIGKLQTFHGYWSNWIDPNQHNENVL